MYRTFYVFLCREVKEECGLDVDAENLEKVAEIDFEFLNDPVVLHVHVFKSKKFSGEVAETEEMLPKWFPADDCPFEQMWPDDKIWYPIYRHGQKFKAYFLFRGQTEILSYYIRDFYDSSKIITQLKLKQSI